MAKFIVCGHGLTINQEMILVPGASLPDNESEDVTIYTRTKCGKNINIVDSPSIIHSIAQGHLRMWKPHIFMYHDSEILLCLFYFDATYNKTKKDYENSRTLLITSSGVYSPDVLNDHLINNAIHNVFYSTQKKEDGHFWLNKLEIKKLYKGSIYPSEQIIDEIFGLENNMKMLDFVRHPLIDMKMSNLIKILQEMGYNKFNLFVLACREMANNNLEDARRRLDSSGDSYTPDLFDEAELDEIENSLQTQKMTVQTMMKNKHLAKGRKIKWKKQTLRKRRSRNLKRRSKRR